MTVVKQPRKIPRKPTGNIDRDHQMMAEAINLLADIVPKVPEYAGYELGELYDNFLYDNELELGISWPGNSNPTSDISSVSDSTAPGGKAVRFGDNSGDDHYWGYFDDYLIQYDGQSLYEVGVIVRQVSGSGTFYCGLEGVAADGTTLVNRAGDDNFSNQHYVAASNVSVGSSFTTYRGFVRGWDATPSTTNKNDPSNPGQMYTGVAFIRPMFIVNHNNEAGEADIAALWVRRIDGELAATDLDDLVVPDTGINIASRGWHITTPFSATDANTVSWSSGNFYSSDGTSYSIGEGNTGNMTARTYIYLDIGVSTTAYQTSTTATDAIGSGKVLIGVAEDASDEAFFQIFGGLGGTLLSANEIAANAITANELAANAVTAVKINAGEITAAKIDSLELTTQTLNASVGNIGGWTLASSSLSAGNVTIHADDEEILIGSATAPLTGTGVFIGSDGSSNYDFRAGNPAGEYIHWDGSAGLLSIIGDVQLSSAQVQTFTPTWTGFSTAPTGTLSYINLGTHAMLWTAANRTGTSNAVTMTITNVPAAIQATYNVQIMGVGTDNAAGSGVMVGASSTGSTITFNMVDSSGTYLKSGINTWSNTGTKGLLAGCILFYPL